MSDPSGFHWTVYELQRHTMLLEAMLAAGEDTTTAVIEHVVRLGHAVTAMGKLVDQHLRAHDAPAR